MEQENKFLQPLAVLVRRLETAERDAAGPLPEPDPAMRDAAGRWLCAMMVGKPVEERERLAGRSFADSLEAVAAERDPRKLRQVAWERRAVAVDMARCVLTGGKSFTQTELRNCAKRARLEARTINPEMRDAWNGLADMLERIRSLLKKYRGENQKPD
jgi:hypothetical protein